MRSAHIKPTICTITENKLSRDLITQYKKKSLPDRIIKRPKDQILYKNDLSRDRITYRFSQWVPLERVSLQRPNQAGMVLLVPVHMGQNSLRWNLL